ncbi:tautomerase family protein [Cellulomonas chengniuliangii]|uniref:Tautomerase family protein n=1 Tax=Cellulomonas chengniuliangii TaxID=2968084 RepID=A0ABY5L359_9CELL|nr:tautomerase family protein [Cellulomonas chengniuliangii]MCC2308087.1 tautomerase family protein [Cellulomonas chengniuliangii]MCC2318309.1 tautomerase family protein [Cellulomonas chengniuliangii]UUI76483.1 tautomerase family protein [Cellulomonas chengniuliangii]
MAQVKVYGRRDVWGPRRREVSDAVHAALVSTWGVPQDQRFHRFLLLDADDLLAPRSREYLILEVLCFSGRGPVERRALINAMYVEVAPALGLGADDLEIVIIESPPGNWGLRGVAGNELLLSRRAGL